MYLLLSAAAGRGLPKTGDGLNWKGNSEFFDIQLTHAGAQGATFEDILVKLFSLSHDRCYQH
jgi:hypothetical protein